MEWNVVGCGFRSVTGICGALSRRGFCFTWKLLAILVRMCETAAGREQSSPTSGERAGCSGALERKQQELLAGNWTI